MRGMRLLRRVLALMLAVGCMLACQACGSVDSDNMARNADGSLTITLAGWTLSTRPEFQALADAYHATHPDITVKVKEYSSEDYDKQLIADLSAGSSTDVFPIKNLRMFYTYAEPGALADLSDVAAKYKGNKDLRGLSSYQVGGKIYAMPYRQDVWVLFYNVSMLKKLGQPVPDGTWTWDDFEEHCKQIATALKREGNTTAHATYMHDSWQSVPQSIALAQSGADQHSRFFSGNYEYLAPTYERMLRMEDEGLELTYTSVSSSNTTYQSQFGTQQAVLLPMATWYMGPLAQGQEDGDAQKFDWGISILPQASKQDTKNPVSFGDPTGFAVSSHLTGERLKAAKDFVSWASGPEAAQVLAATGTLPAYWSKDVLNAFLDHPNMPNNGETRHAITANTIIEENPVGEATQVIQDELLIAHTSILSRTKTPQKALERAGRSIRASGLLPSER